MSESVEAEKSCCCVNNEQENKMTAHNSKAKETIQPVSSILLSVLIAIFPKCPLCWAAYMSMFGSFGLSNIPYMKWLLPALITLLGLNLFLLTKKIKEKGYSPFLLSLLGAIFIIYAKAFLPYNKPIIYTGMALILLGTLLNSFPTKYFRTLFKTENTLR